MRFGNQVDINGIVALSPDADRAIRYLTKSLIRAVTETYADPDGETLDPAYEAHVDGSFGRCAGCPARRSAATGSTWVTVRPSAITANTA